MSRRIRRTMVVALAGLSAASFAIGPARADTVTFVGSASGTALELKVLGQGLTLGHATASADSGPKASASGEGVFEPIVDASATKAEAGAGQTASQPQKCATPALPAALAAVLNVGAACSSASADGNAPSASATGTVAAIDLAANTVLDQLPVTEPVENALEQILGQLPEPLDPVTDTVGGVLEGVLHTQTLAVKLGNSTAEVTSSGSTVTAKASAAGGQVDILPQGGLNGQALVTILVGSSSASASFDRTTGALTDPKFDPAIVTVIVRTPLAGEQKIPVAPGQDITILTGTPLESRIVAGSGSVVTAADGSKKAVADAVRLELLKGLNGGVVLGIGHSEAGVNGAVEIARVLAEQPAPPELPRTGGIPALPVMGAGLVAVALVTRRLVFTQA